MLLQISKTAKDLPKGEAAHVLVDYVEGITHTQQSTDAIKCFKKDGTQIRVLRTNEFEVEVENLDNYDGFNIHAVYLLNDEGKTLRKLA